MLKSYWHLILLILPYFLLFCVSSTKTESFVQKQSDESYNILMLLAVSTETHRSLFWTVAEALANKGHKITILSRLKPRGGHKNIKEIFHGKGITDTNKLNSFNITNVLAMVSYYLTDLAKNLYDSPKVMEIYSQRQSYDLMMVDAVLNQLCYPILQGSRYVNMHTGGIERRASAILGNVLNPAYFPVIVKPSTFLKRLESLLKQLYFYTQIHFYLNYNIETELKKRFPKFTSIRDVEKGLVLSLANTHFSTDTAIPLLPSQVEVGGMHCREPKKLPEDLQSFLDEADEHGVIYFSLGSTARSSLMKPEHLKVFVEAFKKLKMKVLWKMDGHVEGLGNNVMLKNYLPQQDVLGHKNVILFITHGGLLSLQEAIFHRVPLLALPIIVDQPDNARRIKNRQFGTYIEWNDLTLDLLMGSIKEVISNPVYRKSINEASKAFRDQPMHPTDKAVWWIEYVIRSKGAPLLKSTAAELSWIEYLMLDVVFCLIAALVLALVVMKLLVKMLSRLFTFKYKKD